MDTFSASASRPPDVPDAPTTGPYLGITLLLNTPWPLVLLPPMMLVLHWGVVRHEERYLEAKFGEPYRAYHSRVRRWI